ncbi:uncharacterized protein LOC122267779 isoform X2 [Penaeus japonicus]|uniref:uncharacterized protein LOC122267779 isoform X2 n=1 Tax=Penaeus japonicus TaxID=27405 RepID=UPI001C7106AA|nr:uncharacterized protein LOC122267779 isoform X2 [Penaeus japonicus]
MDKTSHTQPKGMDKRERSEDQLEKQGAKPKRKDDPGKAHMTGQESQKDPVTPDEQIDKETPEHQSTKDFKPTSPVQEKAGPSWAKTQDDESYAAVTSEMVDIDYDDGTFEYIDADDDFDP